MAKADLEKAKQLYPSTQMGEKEWIAFFDTPAGFAAMGAIIGDIFDEVKAEEEKEAGVKRMGRRPSRTASLTEVWATVFPAPYSMDPFPETLAKLLNGRSQRAFAKRIPCNQSTLSRLLSGEWNPDITMLERIAEAARVSPAYFVEYRALFIGQVITKVLISSPNLGVTQMRLLRGARSEWDASREPLLKGARQAVSEQ
jgi:transcriptional regulator with XRE-family HTH domain